MIFVSAGFDAHEKDHIHLPRDTKITEFEYQWATEQLVQVANQYCEGRIISVLEGGYSTRSGPLSPLAQSVTHHVRALVQADWSGLGGLLEDPAALGSEEQQIDENEAERQHQTLSQAYFDSAKRERSLLKKRRAEFYEEMELATFMRMPLRRKVPRRHEDQGHFV